MVCSAVAWFGNNTCQPEACRHCSGVTSTTLPLHPIRALRINRSAICPHQRSPRTLGLLAAAHRQSHRKPIERLSFPVRRGSLPDGQGKSGSGRAGGLSALRILQGRKALLSRLGEVLNLLRTWRLAWQRLDAPERARYSEVKPLLQVVQDSLVKILVLDRENQQALLRRGLVPAQYMPSFTSQPPHHAAQVYRRHSS